MTSSGTPCCRAMEVRIAWSATDMARAIDFYRRVGLEFDEETGDEVHAEAVGPGGLRVMLDTEASVMSFSSWQPPTGGSPRTALAFLCDSPAEVDRLFAELAGAGSDHQAMARIGASMAEVGAARAAAEDAWLALAEEAEGA